MFFRDVIGHTELKAKLRGMVVSGRVPHAMLLAGPLGVGKLALALALAQYICCANRKDDEPCGVCPSCVQMAKLAHPDIHFVFPIAKSKTDGIVLCGDMMEEFRKAVLKNPYLSMDDWMDEASNGKTGQIYADEGDEILKKLSFKPYQGDWKVMVMWMPEKMNEACANKVLKIVEEPPLDTVFILVSDNLDGVLGTIRSRCQMISVPPVAEEDMKEALRAQFQLDGDDEDFLVRSAKGSWGRLLALMEHNEEMKTDFDLFVRMMRLAWSLDIRDIRVLTEDVAALSRERQIRFMQNAQRLLRENFILRLGIGSLNYMSRDEAAFASKFSQFIHERNVVDIMDELALAEAQIAQNGNTKIILFHLEVVLYKLLKKPRV